MVFSNGFPLKKKGERALAGVAQWIECWPENQKVPVVVGTHAWVAGQSPAGSTQESNRLDVSLPHQCFSPFLSPPSSLSKIN